MVTYYAHSRNTAGQRQELTAHLQGVADRAAQFAGDFGADEIARLIGLWHDVGKFNPAFQQYLFDCEAHPKAHGRGPDHKAAGVQIAIAQRLAMFGLLIQGHHGGLKTRTDMKTWLAERTRDGAAARAVQTATSVVPGLLAADMPVLPAAIMSDPLAAELYLRMLFSSLVDADGLDTEAHFSAHKAARRGSAVTIEALWEKLERYQSARTGQDRDIVSQCRHEIYEACLAAAERPPGLFRLTVPTGGGKTLSGMAFALRHAALHGLRRVIVAVPFISITEQTAKVYREMFDSDPDDPNPAVLEHHSAADAAVAGAADPDEGDFHPSATWSRLAAENWDAPMIVTTTVQLFESLFANRTSTSRKNHRLARSVIVLDEAQALPLHLLDPILDALRRLCEDYGATVVISTATQPAFAEIPAFAALPATEIVPRPKRYFDALKRVEYEWRTERPLEWSEVAELARAERSALMVVNTRRDALALLDALDDPATLHLSTRLCGAHRRAALAEVRGRLAAGEPCRLVSTQVIEAGVDVDFPLVLRALGPLDSVIQAAGRCNREGRLPMGRVIVFQPSDGGLPPGSYRIATDVTRTLLGDGRDPHDPDFTDLYFRRLVATVETDREGIQELRKELNYPDVAQKFRMIADDTESVVISSYGDDEQRATVRRLLDALRAGNPAIRGLLRRLQPYLVSVRTREAAEYRKIGWIENVIPGLGEWQGAYDAVSGLVGTDPEPGAFVI